MRIADEIERRIQRSRTSKEVYKDASGRTVVTATTKTNFRGDGAPQSENGGRGVEKALVKGEIKLQAGVSFAKKFGKIRNGHVISLDRRRNP